MKLDETEEGRKIRGNKAINQQGLFLTISAEYLAAVLRQLSKYEPLRQANAWLLFRGGECMQRM